MTNQSQIIAPSPPQIEPVASLDRLVDPRSIVIIGASDRPGSLGSRTVSNLLDHSDFQGAVHLVNPGRAEIRGRPCYKSVADLPEAPDVALLVVPADRTMTALQECADKGARFAIVFTSGFGEMGEAGRAAESEMARIGRESGMRIYGPNSPGLCNLNKRLGMMFSPSFQVDQRPGPIGLATQGGGIGRCFLQAMERGVGVGLWASTGNEVDLKVSDFIRYMADADDITTIATAMEGIKNGPDFVEAALYAAERGKPVIALKVGRSDYGARAVQSHTGSISGAAEVNSAVFRQAGVVEVDDLDELIDTAALFSRQRPRGGEKVAVFGFSGGACALAADAVGEAGLELAAFSQDTLQRVGDALPDYAAINNPVDATSDILTDPDIGYRSLKAVAEDPDVGVILYPFPCDYAELTETIAVSTVQTQQEIDVPIVAVWTSDRLGEGWKALIEGGFVPSRGVKQTTKAIRRWVERGAWNASHENGWRPVAAGQPKTPVASTFSEVAAKTLMRQAGIAVPDGGLAASAQEAGRLAAQIGFPVVAKIVSPDILHKSDIGGVVVAINDEASAHAAYDGIIASVKAARPDAAIEGVLIEKMAAKGGLEFLVGVNRDPVFGPIITFGMGGVFVELFKDVSRRMLPLTRTSVKEMVREPKCAQLLEGYRGSGPADIESLETLLLAVSDFVCAQADVIEEFELNPVWVGPVGSGAVALDAVLTTTGPLEVIQ